MSYCRMGVDGSELYCYEHVDGGWVTWVNGMTFRDLTRQGFRSRLLSLRDEGYVFPDYVLTEIEEEIRVNDADIERLIVARGEVGMCPCDWCADRRAGKQMVAAAPADDWPTFDFGAAIRGLPPGFTADSIREAQAQAKERAWLLPSRTHEQDTPGLLLVDDVNFPPARDATLRFVEEMMPSRFLSAMADAPQTITRAADDVDFIRKRIKENEEERIQALRNRDPDVATGEHLDAIGADYGEKRTYSGESDSTFRPRLLKKVRGDA